MHGHTYIKLQDIVNTQCNQSVATFPIYVNICINGVLVLLFVYLKVCTLLTVFRWVATHSKLITDNWGFH